MARRAAAAGRPSQRSCGSARSCARAGGAADAAMARAGLADAASPCRKCASARSAPRRGVRHRVRRAAPRAPGGAARVARSCAARWRDACGSNTRRIWRSGPTARSPRRRTSRTLLARARRGGPRRGRRWRGLGPRGSRFTAGCAWTSPGDDLDRGGQSRPPDHWRAQGRPRRHPRPAGDRRAALALGEATKTVAYVMEGRKHYRFTARLGEARRHRRCRGRGARDQRATPDERGSRPCCRASSVGSSRCRPSPRSRSRAARARRDLARRGEAVELAARPVRRAVRSG